MRVLIGLIALFVFTSANSDTLSVTTVWRGKPIPEQVPFSDERFTPGSLRVNAALWFNDSVEVATLAIDNQRVDITDVTLHCAPAGVEGPTIWYAPSTGTGANPSSWQISNEELISNQDDCEVLNVAGLRAAANKRLLYVEYEREGQRHRGQLWPKSLMADHVTSVYVVATPGQVYPAPSAASNAKTLIRFRLSENGDSLDRIGYSIRNEDGQTDTVDAGLYCGPPGREGELVAELRPRGGHLLTNSSVQSISPGGVCGMTINNIASVVEALMRGKLYVHLLVKDGTIRRGQILNP